MNAPHLLEREPVEHGLQLRLLAQRDGLGRHLHVQRAPGERRSEGAREGRWRVLDEDMRRWKWEGAGAQNFKTKGTHPFCLMVCVMTSMAALSTSIPRSLSSVMLVMTYMGGAMSLMRTGTSGEPRFSPARRASRMASMPS